MTFRCNQHTPVVLKFLHGLYVLVAAGTDSRVHLLRILAQHRVHGGADRPRSVTLEPVSRCHPSCTGRCTRFGNNPRIRNGNWQQLCTALPPAPAPQPEQLSRESCRTSRRRQHRQPRKADVRPCTAPCVRRYASTAQLGSRTSFTLPLVLQEPVHTARQQPALTTCNCQRVCTPFLPSRCTGMRHQHNSGHLTLRPNKPRPCAQPTCQSARPCAQLLRARSRATAGTPNRNEHSTRTGSASTLLHTQLSQ